MTRCTPECSGSRAGWPRLPPLAAADPDYLEIARRELYRGQCNCPYWHGAFGGLYLPHLRNAIYRSLINAHNALDEAEGKTGPRVTIEVADYNLDARQEVKLENDSLIALVRPAQGGHLYELDLRQTAINLLATLQRRPEAYHQAILDAIHPGAGHQANKARLRRAFTIGSSSSKRGSIGSWSTIGIRARRSSITSIRSRPVSTTWPPAATSNEGTL